MNINMSHPPTQDPAEIRGPESVYLSPLKHQTLYKRHLEGAFVNSGAIVAIWFFLLISWYYQSIDTPALIGVSIIVSSFIGGMAMVNVPAFHEQSRVLYKK